MDSGPSFATSVTTPGSQMRLSRAILSKGKSGDAVGAIRNVRIGDTCIRQRLLAHSDLDRSYTYGFCEPSPYPVRNYCDTTHQADHRW